MPLRGFWDTLRPQLLELLQATPAGLASDEAQRRLGLHGPNSMVRESRFAAPVSLLRFLINPLVIILLVASGISLVLGDSVGGLIIIAIVLLSVLLNFFMEFQAQHATSTTDFRVGPPSLLVARLRGGWGQPPCAILLTPPCLLRT
jgi:magnesium-transporting ATPase (P-type)